MRVQIRRSGREGRFSYVAEKRAHANSQESLDRDKLHSPSKSQLSVTALRRGRICHGKLRSPYHFTLRNIILSHILPLDNLDFERENVCIMTDESQPWNLPTKENIVSPPREMLLLLLHLVS